MKRRSFTIAECVVALVLLGAAMALMMQTVAAVSQQRRVADQHALALQETANLMERLFALPFAELSSEQAAKLHLSGIAQQRLPGALLEIAVAPAAGEPAAKEIRLALRWLDRSGQYGSPLQLTAWRHQRARSGA